MQQTLWLLLAALGTTVDAQVLPVDTGRVVDVRPPTWERDSGEKNWVAPRSGGGARVGGSTGGTLSLTDIGPDGLQIDSARFAMDAAADYRPHFMADGAGGTWVWGRSGDQCRVIRLGPALTVLVDRLVTLPMPAGSAQAAGGAACQGLAVHGDGDVSIGDFSPAVVRVDGASGIVQPALPLAIPEGVSVWLGNMATLDELLIVPGTRQPEGAVTLFWLGAFAADGSLVWQLEQAAPEDHVNSRILRDGDTVAILLRMRQGAQSALRLSRVNAGGAYVLPPTSLPAVAGDPYVLDFVASAGHMAVHLEGLGWHVRWASGQELQLPTQRGHHLVFAEGDTAWVSGATCANTFQDCQGRLDRIDASGQVLAQHLLPDNFLPYAVDRSPSGVVVVAGSDRYFNGSAIVEGAPYAAQLMPAGQLLESDLLKESPIAVSGRTLVDNGAWVELGDGATRLIRYDVAGRATTPQLEPDGFLVAADPDGAWIQVGQTPVRLQRLDNRGGVRAELDVAPNGTHCDFAAQVDSSLWVLCRDGAGQFALRHLSSAGVLQFQRDFQSGNAHYLLARDGDTLRAAANWQRYAADGTLRGSFDDLAFNIEAQAPDGSLIIGNGQVLRRIAPDGTTLWQASLPAETATLPPRWAPLSASGSWLRLVPVTGGGELIRMDVQRWDPQTGALTRRRLLDWNLPQWGGIQAGTSYHFDRTGEAALLTRRDDGDHVLRFADDQPARLVRLDNDLSIGAGRVFWFDQANEAITVAPRPLPGKLRLTSATTGMLDDGFEATID